MDGWSEGEGGPLPFVRRQNKGISDDKCQACARSTGFAGKELQVSSRWVVTGCKGSTMVEDWTGEGGGTGNERETFIESSDKK